VRLARIFATGLYLFGFSVGLLTLAGGCGGSKPEELVPAKTEVSEEERKGRMEAMKKAEEARRRER